MPYLVTCHDKTNSLDLRLSTRAKHLRYLSSFKKEIMLAGPILSERQDPIGTVLILNYEKLDQVNNFLKNDPYSKVQLFKKISILEFKKVL